MKIDPTQLRVSEAARLLNSTPLGEVARANVLYGHLNRAGVRVGDGQRIHLVKYAAWLFHERRRLAGPAAPEGGNDPGYESHRERARARSAAASRSGRDIGPLPDVENPERRAAAAASLRVWCETYHASTFWMGWSDVHLKAVETLERVVRGGGLFAFAMPRGWGKTALTEAATEWAVYNGLRRYVVAVGATKDLATGILDSVKVEAQTNPMLLADYPEVCYPIHRLEGITQRCKGQLCCGVPTWIHWTDSRLVFPTVAGSDAGGAIIEVRGLTGAIRGMSFRRPDGDRVRPDLALLDDPQDDESAWSPAQCAKRERIVEGTVLYLAGPEKPIACAMPCTVICKGDMADRFLDRDQKPEWQGVRSKMVVAFPTSARLWEQYAEVRAEGLRAEDGGRAANAFYAEHREAMDKGAQVTWPQRKAENELSALQHAMNLRLRNEHAFFSECQNEPLEESAGVETPDPKDLAKKTNGVRRGLVPVEFNKLVAFVDVQKAALWYCVVAVGDNFNGAVVDYGAYPEQRRQYFTNRDVKRTLARAHSGRGFEATLYAGLEALADRLLERDWKRADGTELRVQRMPIDANWGDSTDVVYQFCRETRWRTVVVPSHGKGIGAAEQPMSEWKKQQGETVGTHWRYRSGRRKQRFLIYETNFWKTLAMRSLATAKGDPGSIALFDAKPAAHRMFCEHVTSEPCHEVQSRGRAVVEWQQPRHGRDNHLWDCFVGCVVAASMEGVTSVGHQPAPRGGRRPRVSYGR